MDFTITRIVEILTQTPNTVRSLLGDLSNEWVIYGPPRDSEWNPFDIVGHLIHGEKTDWVPRARIILAQGKEIEFVPFDRFAQFEMSKGKTVRELLDEFETRRIENLEALRSMNITDEQLSLKGLHPELGDVTLKQLLATWAVHDLTHIRQIVTQLAKRQESNVGPWKEYLSILE